MMMDFGPTPLGPSSTSLSSSGGYAAASAAPVARDCTFLVIEPGGFAVKAGSSDYQFSPSARVRSDGFSRPTQSSQQPDQQTDQGLLDYVFGVDADAAAKADPAFTPTRPMINGRVADWNAFEALIKHIVVKELRIRRKKNTHPALIVIPPSWGIPDVELFVQIMFEQMNVPGLFVGDAPVMAAFGCGVLSALVIDIGHDTTSISAVVDCVFQRHASQTIPVGGRTLRTYLATLLKAEPALKDAPIDDAFVKALLESELCEVKPFKEMALPPLVDGTKPVDFEYDGKTYPIGAARFKVMECLFDPSLAKVHEMSIADLAVLVAGASVEQLDKRLALWDSVLLTGGVSPVKGLKERLENELNSRLSASQTSNEFQAKDCKFVKVPEYFLAYKDSPGDITFLGGIITAKLTLSTSQHITKADYNEMGPAVFRFKQL